MNLWQMEERVRRIVNDPSQNGDDVLVPLFNEGLQDVATLVNLPALDTWGEVPVASLASNASLPDGFMRDLHTIYDTARQDVDIPIMASRRLLREVAHAGDGPAIAACCEEGGVLYFAPAPATSTSLVVGYYRMPAELANPTDIPAELPMAFHDAALVNYVAFRLFSRLEEGEAGETVMTARYQSFYQQALVSLAAQYPDTSRKRTRRIRRARWF